MTFSFRLIILHSDLRKPLNIFTLTIQVLSTVLEIVSIYYQWMGVTLMPNVPDIPPYSQIINTPKPSRGCVSPTLPLPSSLCRSLIFPSCPLLIILRRPPSALHEESLETQLPGRTTFHPAAFIYCSRPRLLQVQVLLASFFHPTRQSNLP